MVLDPYRVDLEQPREKTQKHFFSGKPREDMRMDKIPLSQKKLLLDLYLKDSYATDRYCRTRCADKSAGEEAIPSRCDRIKRSSSRIELSTC